MDLRTLRNSVMRTQAAEDAFRTRGCAGFQGATRELASIEERIRASEVIGNYRQGVSAASTPLHLQHCHHQPWKTASIYRYEATDRLQTNKSHISPKWTRTKQLKIMRITKDVTSYEKLKEKALQVVCINLPGTGHAVLWDEDEREVAVQDVQVIWTGGEAQGEDADDGSWFTSLKGLADEEISLCLEKMEERERTDRLAVVFRLSEDNWSARLREGGRALC
ncbi:hypothetical protein ACEPPN_002962 [Leptodophora sp. 'Broadleaf-Isolate-01']